MLTKAKRKEYFKELGLGAYSEKISKHYKRLILERKM